MSENNIVNPNADAQETAPVAEITATEASAATTNEPVVEASVTESIPEPVAETVAAHDDFDWSIDKRNVSHYSPEEKKNITKFMTTPSCKLKMAKL